MKRNSETISEGDSEDMLIGTASKRNGEESTTGSKDKI